MSLLSRRIYADLLMSIPYPIVGLTAQYKHRMTGRHFHVECFETGVFYACEMPAANLELVAGVNNNPNSTAASAAALGISGEQIVRRQGNRKVGSIYYQTIQEASEAICDAIDSNELLKDHRTEDEIRDGMSQLEWARKLYDEAEFRLSVWQEDLDEIEAASINLADDEPIPPLTEHERRRVIDFFREPGFKTWQRCFDIMIGTRTMWEIWRAYDDLAPTELDADGGWPAYPEASNFGEWVRMARVHDYNDTKARCLKARTERDHAKAKLDSILKSETTSNVIMFNSVASK